MSQKRNLATLDEFTNNDDITNGFRDKYSKRNNAEEAVPLKNSTSDERRLSSQDDVDVEEEPKSDTYESHKQKISKKYKLPFIIACIVAVAFFIIFILIIAFWPNVPDYMRSELCLEKECVAASQQMLLCADTSTEPCSDPYQWACGKFESEYRDYSFYGVHKGEWNFQAFHEYEDIKNLNFLISSLPQQSYSYTPATILKGLYKSCRELENLDSQQGQTQLKKAIHNIGGWKLLQNGKSFEIWSYRDALTKIQPIYGAHPFFTITVGSRNVPPYDSIIVLDEGDVGMPHKVYYGLGNTNEVLDSYKLLLRDFAINMGIVGNEAENFADGVFHYEKRIVAKTNWRKNESDEPDNKKVNQIMTLGEIRKRIPMIPLEETLQIIFSNTKIMESTEILVRDITVLEGMSHIIATSDDKALNDFIIWSLARKFLPFMSREFRKPVERFEALVYGNKTATPQWFFCAKIVRDWMPFAVDVLQQNPDLLKIRTRRYEDVYDEPRQEPFRNDHVDYNAELAKLIFFHVRNILQEAIENAVWMNITDREAITSKLSAVSLQIGIPESVLESNKYANEYYFSFVLQNLFFVDNLVMLRRLENDRMEKKLQKLNLTDAIISELYPGYDQRMKSFGFISDRNIAIISKKMIEEPFFNYKYPLSLNFARFGVAIAELLLKSTSIFVDESNEDSLLFGENLECLLEHVSEKSLPNIAIKNIFAKLSATDVAFKAFINFVDLVQSNEPVVGAPLTEGVNYEDLHLINRKLQPGLRSYNDPKLFLLGAMQTHCAVSFEAYKRFKPFVEGQISEKELFTLVWSQVPHMTGSMSCSEDKRACSDIL